MATIIKGKVDSVNQREGTSGAFWYVKINNKEYYCGDPWVADKQDRFVSMEYYQTKNKKDALRPLDQKPSAPPAESDGGTDGGGGDKPAGKREWVPRWKDTEEGDRLEKAFSCRTMTLSYACRLVADAYAGVPRPAGPGSDMTALVKAMFMDALRGYMVLHDTVAMGTDLPGSEKMFLDTKVGESPNIKAPSGGGPATAEQRKEVIELASQLGVVPIKVANKYIGRVPKNMNDFTAAEAEKVIESLKAEIDVPF